MTGTSRASGFLRAPALLATAVVSGLLATLLVHIPGARASGEGTIAFVSDRDGDAEIFTIAPDGSGLKRITENTAWDTDPAWSPDLSRIAFSSNRDGDDDIYIMSATGSGVVNVTGAGTGRDVQPAWSPDGSKIAFVRDGVVHVVGSDGGSAPVRLGRGISPAWSPDGAKIAHVRPTQGSNDVYLMNPDGSGAKALTSGLEAGEPAWSPDGSKIAVESTATVDGGSRIAIVNADGTQPLFLPGEGEDFAPSWSPDGRSLVLTNLGLDADLVVMGVAGDRRNLVTGASYDLLPAWSPCPVTAACSPEASPTPTTTPTTTPTGTPTATPTATPTDDPDGERAATATTLQFQKTKRRIKVAGSVLPTHADERVKVILWKRKAGRWVKVTAKRPLMDADGVYSTGFRNPARTKRCRLKARFAGDEDHLPSSRAKRFRC